MKHAIEMLPHFSAGPVVLESAHPGVVDPAFNLDDVLEMRSAFDPFNNETAIKLYDQASPRELLQIFEDGFVMASLLDAILPPAIDNSDDVFAVSESDRPLSLIDDDMMDDEDMDLSEEEPRHLHP